MMFALLLCTLYTFTQFLLFVDLTSVHIMIFVSEFASSPGLSCQESLFTAGPQVLSYRTHLANILDQ